MKKLLIIVLLFEILLFLMLYCFGPNGYQVLSALSNQRKVVQCEVVILEKEIQFLEQQIKDSQTSFAKEKIARERLLMKKDNETVFFRNTMRS